MLCASTLSEDRLDNTQSKTRGVCVCAHAHTYIAGCPRALIYAATSQPLYYLPLVSPSPPQNIFFSSKLGSSSHLQDHSV